MEPRWSLLLLVPMCPRLLLSSEAPMVQAITACVEERTGMTKFLAAGWRDCCHGNKTSTNCFVHFVLFGWLCISCVLIICMYERHFQREMSKSCFFSCSEVQQGLNKDTENHCLLYHLQIIKCILEIVPSFYTKRVLYWQQKRLSKLKQILQ